MQFQGWALGFHTRLVKPPTPALRPIIPNNACALRITAAAGTELAGTSFGGTVKTAAYSTTAHSSLPTEVYDPRAFIPHAALLGQAFAHCPRFPTAASRRSLDRVSVPVWLIILSDQLPIKALVSRYLTNKLMGRGLINRRQLPRRGHLFPQSPKTSWSYPVLAPVSRSCPRPRGRLPTRYSPVRHSCTPRREPYRSTCMS